MPTFISLCDTPDAYEKSEYVFSAVTCDHVCTTLAMCEETLRILESYYATSCPDMAFMPLSLVRERLFELMQIFDWAALDCPDGESPACDGEEPEQLSRAIAFDVPHA